MLQKNISQDNEPRHFVKLGRKIEKLIRKIGIFRMKVQKYFHLSKILMEKYNEKYQKLMKN